MPDSESGHYQDESTDFSVDSLAPADNELPAHRSRLLILLCIFLAIITSFALLAVNASHWKKEVIVRGFVVDGESIIPESELLLRVADYKETNLQQLDVDELKQSLMTLPYLKSAVISKELNGVVRLRVVEREPVALAVIGRNTMVIDREGFLLPWSPAVAEHFPGLFSIAGINRLKVADNGLQQLDQKDVVLILQFLDALAAADYASLIIREFHLAGNNLSWCIAAHSPTRFIIGNAGNFKEKLKKFEIFWQKVVSKKGFEFYDTVDLRFKERVFTTVPLSLEVRQVVAR